MAFDRNGMLQMLLGMWRQTLESVIDSAKSPGETSYDHFFKRATANRRTQGQIPALVATRLPSGPLFILPLLPSFVALMPVYSYRRLAAFPPQSIYRASMTPTRSSLNHHKPFKSLKANGHNTDFFAAYCKESDTFDGDRVGTYDGDLGISLISQVVPVSRR